MAVTKKTTGSRPSEKSVVKTVAPSVASTSPSSAVKPTVAKSSNCESSCNGTMNMNVISLVLIVLLVIMNFYSIFATSGQDVTKAVEKVFSTQFGGEENYAIFKEMANSQQYKDGYKKQLLDQKAQMEGTNPSDSGAQDTQAQPQADANNPISVESLTAKAVALGADATAFKTCLDSGKYATKTASDMEYGAKTFGINGTPGIVVLNTKNGKWSKPTRDYNSLKTAIDAYLADTSVAAPGDTNVLSADQIASVTEGYKEGSKTPAVVIMEYSDVQCPYCRSYFSEGTLKKISSDYASSVVVMFKHFPLSFHPYAQKGAEALECAGEQLGESGFWSYHDTVYTD